MLTREIMRQEALTAGQAIALYKQAGIRRVFPGQYLESTLDQIEAAASRPDRSARRALKLLFSREYDK